LQQSVTLAALLLLAPLIHGVALLPAHLLARFSLVPPEPQELGGGRGEGPAGPEDGRLLEVTSSRVPPRPYCWGIRCRRSSSSRAQCLRRARTCSATSLTREWAASRFTSEGLGCSPLRTWPLRCGGGPSSTATTLATGITSLWSPAAQASWCGGWGTVGVRRVYEGDPEFEMPTLVGADGSIQRIPAGLLPAWPAGHLRVGLAPPRRLNCCQTCDKALCGFFDGCVARWSVAHFGQEQAGSAINCITLFLLRHAGLRWPAAVDLRGASSHYLCCVVWVDDFVFYFLTQWHDA
jgi:hypothetical protein